MIGNMKLHWELFPTWLIVCKEQRSLKKKTSEKSFVGEMLLATEGESPEMRQRCSGFPFVFFQKLEQALLFLVDRVNVGLQFVVVTFEFSKTLFFIFQLHRRPERKVSESFTNYRGGCT